MSTQRLEEETAGEGNRSADAFAVPIASLVRADTPRQTGVNAEHVRVLADVAGELPPILVHRPTMRIIDGVHRVQAALARGQETVLVRFFEGDDAEAFVLAVQANVGHGLPLTLSERRAAAARIVRAYPHWSDRRIAAVAGISPKTAGVVRARSSGEIPQSRVREGLDGRVRRVPSRPVPARPVERRPENAPVPVRARTPPEPAPAPLGDRSTAQAAALHALRRDPSLRFSETGRTLLRLLDLHTVQSGTWACLADTVPSHCAGMVAELARECAEAWQLFADCLEERSP